MKEERIKQIRNSIDSQIKQKGFVTVVDTFIDVGILDKQNNEKLNKNWLKSI